MNFLQYIFVLNIAEDNLIDLLPLKESGVGFKWNIINFFFYLFIIHLFIIDLFLWIINSGTFGKLNFFN